MKPLVSLATRVKNTSEVGRNILFTPKRPLLIFVFLKTYLFSIHDKTPLSISWGIILEKDILEFPQRLGLL